MYDFFVVCRGLAAAVAGVQRIEDGGTSPHFFSRLLIRGDGRRFPIRKLVPAPRVAGILPFGPGAEPPDYASVADLARDPSRLDEAMVQFYTLARQEWSSIAGQPLDFVPHKFKIEAPQRELAQPWTGACNLSVIWRSLARRASEVAMIL